MQCSDDEMNQLVGVIRAGSGDELALTDRLVGVYPEDARLHFLRGSLLAAGPRAIEAHAALSRAVALAPGFALARFQLGFFELTSGEPARALGTWAGLAGDDYLARFVAGLTHLIHDRFAEAIEALSAGIAANTDNAPLNRDMQLIIERCRGQPSAAAPAADTAETASATSFLLGQLSGRGTTH